MHAHTCTHTYLSPSQARQQVLKLPAGGVLPPTQGDRRARLRRPPPAQQVNNNPQPPGVLSRFPVSLHACTLSLVMYTRPSGHEHARLVNGRRHSSRCFRENEGVHFIHHFQRQLPPGARKRTPRQVKKSHRTRGLSSRCIAPFSFLLFRGVFKNLLGCSPSHPARQKGGVELVRHSSLSFIQST